MPMTPLHLGLLAPANRFLPGAINPVSFTLVNLWIDAEAIISWWTRTPLPSHDSYGHTFLGAMIAAVILAMPGVRSASWVIGAFTGAISHIFLDAMVHPEVQPFRPVLEGNPLYLGIMEPLSLILFMLTCWLTGQYVSDSLGFWKRLRERGQGPTEERISLELEPGPHDLD
jgi:membrane-bound metal-dependent hydrolase YbcI (DUF457 family)